MNAHAPPVITKRAGDLPATSPNCFEVTDHTPLVCTAQTWCEHSNTRIEHLANGPHHAKEICTDCGQLLRWVAKPETVERQHLNAFRVAKLAMADGLNDWEQAFIKSIGQSKKLSPRQQVKLDELFEKFQIGGRAMTTTLLPQWALDILSAVPKSGEGFHNWLFRAARALRKCGRSESDIREVLENAASTCGRFVPQREIDEAIRNSQVNAFQPLTVQHRPWPSLNREQREAVIQETQFELVDLWEASPVKFTDNKVHSEEIIDAQFPDNPLLCCGRTEADFDTRPRSKWRGELPQRQFIVPSPMIKWLGRTQEGKESAHSLDATGPRRFLVIEQDIGTVDEQAAILWHLACRAPLALVVHSGGKSIHGWFYCAGQDEEKVLRPFMQHAVSLGACHSTWTKSQFVRIPDGTRGDGKRQAVYFFRPEVVK